MILLALLLGSCTPGGPTGSQVVARHPDRPVVIAHRGASAEAPENTLAAYSRAMELGVIAAETDIRHTRDRQVVAFHDVDLSRTTDGEGLLPMLTLAEVQALDAGSWMDERFTGERVPELGELLDRVRGRMVLCIEIKSGLGIEYQVRDALDERHQRSGAVIFSFDGDKVALSKALMPDVPAVWLPPRDRTTGQYLSGFRGSARAIHADGLAFNHEYVEAAQVDRAHEADLPVFLYAIDEEDDVLRALELGADGIITNVPDRVEAMLAATPR